MKGKTYKILIADDEYWTREKLKNMICWEDYGLEFLEPAVDGEDALYKIKEWKPDILITDINMPFIDGVELLSKIQSGYPDMVTFVISGYDDFDYVRSSFLSGAVNYLVKPVSKIDLVNALVKALEIISEREQEKLQLLKAASLIQDREFSQLINRKENAFMPGISVNPGMELAGMTLVLLKIHNLHEIIRQNDHDMNLFSYNIKKELRHLMGSQEAIIFNHIYRSNEFIIVTEMEEKELVKMAEKIRVCFSSFIDSCLTICISTRSYSIESIHMAYVETVSLLMTRKFEPKDALIFPRSASMKNEGAQTISYFSKEHEIQIRNCLKSGNVEALKRVLFDTIGIAKCRENKWTYLEVKQTIRQILNVFVDYIVAEMGKMAATGIDNLMESVDKAAEYLDEKVLTDMLEDIIQYLTPVKQEVPTGTMKNIVHQIAAYIDEHYYEELSLAALAKRYHIESSYFSKVFRQEMGENLILYITKTRIEKAKEYMKNSAVNLTEIAFMVGYDDYTYFSRVFKKNTGQSPREYRSCYLEESN